MSIQHQINELFREWDGVTRQYRTELDAAASAEVAHKSTRAKFIVAARASDMKKSAAQAEMEADADDEIGMLYLDRLGKAAAAEATKQRLFMLRARSDSLRSEKVDERANSQFYADNAPV